MQIQEDKSTLSDSELRAELATLDGWQQQGKYIAKDFVFRNYADINRFLPHLAKSIADQNHHPDFSFDSGAKKVSVRVTTHSKGGITRADINLARALNSWH